MDGTWFLVSFQESGVVSVDVGKAGGAECTHSTEDPGPLTPVIQGPGSGQVITSSLSSQFANNFEKSSSTKKSVSTCRL